MSLKDAAEKPDIKDFRMEKQIGEGNFSRIIKATYKPTSEVFALKVVEKQRVKRLRIRHANIFNEIAMEKDVLNKLRHANVIRLYHTFQDNDNLYFLLEFLDGGELLDHLMHDGRQIGFHEDLARFYLADVVNAVEYLHANQVLHRDLKPENMVVCRATNHLKLIDFGTAKKLDDAALNGPNFVGTPEYMSPETIDNKDVTTASDLWALGCIAFQLLTGETPFSGGSAYLTFLKVQDGAFQLPEFLSADAKDLISKLLVKDPTQRLSVSEIKGKRVCGTHPFFSGVDFVNHMQAPLPSAKFQSIALLNFAKQLEVAEKGRDRARVLDFSAESGDALQPRISALSPHDRSLLMHLLKRKQLLHLPGIYPRFFESARHGRCRYASSGGYVGLTHELQNQWSDCFTFLQLAGPRLGREAASREQDGRGGSSWDTEATHFRRAIAEINRQKPAFVAICGDFVHAAPGDECFAAQLCAFQQLVNEIQSEIRLMFIPGRSGGSEPSESAALVVAHETSFGDARFSFWLGGMKFIVMNSTLLCHPGQFAAEIEQQEAWLLKELENGKLCARGTAVLAFHSLADPHDGDANTATGNNKVSENNPEQPLASAELLPAATRKRYLDLITTAKASLLATSHPHADFAFHVVAPSHDAHTHSASEATGGGDNDDNDNSDSTAREEQHRCEVLACKAPWSTDVIHAVRVAQTGLTLEQLVLESTAAASSGVTARRVDEGKAVAAPEDAESATLSLEGVKLDIAV